MPEMTRSELSLFIEECHAEMINDARRLAELDTADRLAAVREVSTKALRDIILAVLDAQQPDALATASGRAHVAARLAQVLSSL